MWHGLRALGFGYTPERSILDAIAALPVLQRAAHEFVQPSARLARLRLRRVRRLAREVEQMELELLRSLRSAAVVFRSECQLRLERACFKATGLVLPWELSDRIMTIVGPLAPFMRSMERLHGP